MWPLLLPACLTECLWVRNRWAPSVLVNYLSRTASSDPSAVSRVAAAVMYLTTIMWWYRAGRFPFLARDRARGTATPLRRSRMKPVETGVGDGAPVAPGCRSACGSRLAVVQLRNNGTTQG